MGENTTFYIDSNVLIYASVDNGVLGEKARDIISAIEKGHLKAATSCLTIDELIWIVRKKDSREATNVGKLFLDSKIIFLDVNKAVIELSLEMSKELKPRDAIHIATMKLHKLNKIISEDKDFDKINWVKRKGILEMKIKNGSI